MAIVTALIAICGDSGLTDVVRLTATRLGCSIRTGIANLCDDCVPLPDVGKGYVVSAGVLDPDLFAA